MKTERFFDGHFTRRTLFDIKKWSTDKSEREMYDVPIVPVKPVFAKRDTSSYAAFEKDWEDGFIRPTSPWPDYLKHSVSGASVITMEDLFSRISTLRDITYSIPLTPQEIITSNDERPVYVVSTDSSTHHMRDKELGFALLKYYASLAFDWDDPERQEILHRLEGRVRENLPESLLQYATVLGLSMATRNIPLGFAGVYGVKYGNQMRGMVHEYFLSQLAKHVNPGVLDEVSSLTKPLFASTKDIELQHSLMVRNLSQAYSYIEKIDPDVKGPAVALYTLDNSAGNKDVWNDPQMQLKILRSSIFDILKLYRQECLSNNISITPERLLDISAKLHELYGGIDIWKINPKIAQNGNNKKLYIESVRKNITKIHSELNPLMREIIKNKMKDVFPEEFDRIHFSAYNQKI